ncbi:hypothetical protein GJ496_006874 [Pomphorhynchus laevis]|nr:hypothetical protein GJ496_006874 [Pomphorhynchus laevis]
MTTFTITKQINSLTDEPSKSKSDSSDLIDIDLMSQPYSYKNISAEALPELIDKLPPTSIIKIANTRILDYLLLKHASYLDNCSMARILIQLINHPINRNAYCFPVLSRLLQFNVHRLPVLDQIRLDRSLDLEIKAKWAKSLRKALQISIKYNADVSLLSRASSEDLARIMFYGFKVFKSFKRIYSEPMAIDLLTWAYTNVEHEPNTSDLITRCRCFLFENGLSSVIYCNNLLQAIVPAHIPDLKLIKLAFDFLLTQEIDDINQVYKILTLMTKLSVYDDRIINYWINKGYLPRQLDKVIITDEYERFLSYFKNAVNPRLKINKQNSHFAESLTCNSDFELFSERLLKSFANDQYMLFNNKPWAIVNQETKKIFILLSKNDLVFQLDKKAELVLSAYGEAKMDYVRDCNFEKHKIVEFKCLDIFPGDEDLIKSIARDLTDMELCITETKL